MPHNLKDAPKQMQMELYNRMCSQSGNGNSHPVSDFIVSNNTFAYQCDPETKFQAAIFIFADDTVPVKVKWPRSVEKKMVAFFFLVGVSVTTIKHEIQCPVTALWYSRICLN
jgi:hypothetical protein